MKFLVKCHIFLGLFFFLQMSQTGGKTPEEFELYIQKSVENLIEKILTQVEEYYHEIKSNAKCIPDYVPDNIMETLKKAIDCVSENERNYASAAKKEVNKTMAAIDPYEDYCPQNMTIKTYEINVTTTFIKTFQINIKNGLEVTHKKINFSTDNCLNHSSNVSDENVSNEGHGSSTNSDNNNDSNDRGEEDYQRNENDNDDDYDNNNNDDDNDDNDNENIDDDDDDDEEDDDDDDNDDDDDDDDDIIDDDDSDDDNDDDDDNGNDNDNDNGKKNDKNGNDDERQNNHDHGNKTKTAADNRTEHKNRGNNDTKSDSDQDSSEETEISSEEDAVDKYFYDYDNPNSDQKGSFGDYHDKGTSLKNSSEIQSNSNRKSIGHKSYKKHSESEIKKNNTEPFIEGVFRNYSSKDDKRRKKNASKFIE